MTREEFILAVQQLGFNAAPSDCEGIKAISFVGHFCFEDGSRPDLIRVIVYSDSYTYDPTLVVFSLCNRILPEYNEDRQAYKYTHTRDIKFQGKNSYKGAYAYLTED